MGCCCCCFLEEDKRISAGSSLFVSEEAFTIEMMLKRIGEGEEQKMWIKCHGLLMQLLYTAHFYHTEMEV